MYQGVSLDTPDDSQKLKVDHEHEGQAAEKYRIMDLYIFSQFISY
jgi:hypothetical protein